MSTWHSEDVDEVGFTVRTASLMTDPEVEFDEKNPADYAAFGIRWLILPTGMQSPVPAAAVEHRGGYALWEIPGRRLHTGRRHAWQRHRGVW